MRQTLECLLINFDEPLCVLLIQIDLRVFDIEIPTEQVQVPGLKPLLNCGVFAQVFNLLKNKIAGALAVRKSGTTRESEQQRNITVGDCPSSCLIDFRQCKGRGACL